MPVAVSNCQSGLGVAINVPVFVTIDATPLPVTVFSIPPDCTVCGVLHVLARAADGTSKSWQITRTGKNVGNGVVVVGGAPPVVTEADAAAASWAAPLSVQGSDVLLNLTGDPAKTVSWTYLLEHLLLSTAP